MKERKSKPAFYEYLPLVVLFLFCLTPILWFYNRPGVLINGSDTNFPLDPLIWFTRRLFVWNDISNGGVIFSSSLAGMFFHLLQVVVHTVNFSLQQTELITLIFWFALIIFSAYFFSRCLWPGRPSPQAIFVSLYTFNVYIFNTWENVKVANLALVSGLPLVLAIFFMTVQKKMSYSLAILASLVAGVLISGSGINPAYFLSIFLGLGLFVIVLSITSTCKREIGQIWLSAFVITVTLLLVNSFWIFPTVKFLFFLTNRIKNLADIGYTDWLQSLSENTSLVNVFRLQGAWDWYAMDESGTPLYIPYALNYFRKIPFILFGFFTTGLGFISLIFRSKANQSLYLAFAVLLVLGIFLVAGGHEPTGSFYVFLINHLPFFSFFRSPWYIFCPFVILSLAGLSALFFSMLDENGLNKKIITLLVLVVVAGNFFYSYPLITGKIFRPQSSDNFYITFPDYIFEAGKWLNQSATGRVISYPDDEIERFKWGYNSIESILSLVSESENIYSPLSEPLPEISKLSRQLYINFKKGQSDLALSIAGKLNASLIHEKSDQSSLAPRLPSGIINLPVQKFGLWSFYSVPEEYSLPKIYAPKGIYFGFPYNRSEEVISVLKAQDLLVSPNDTIINGVKSMTSNGKAIVYSTNSQAQEAYDFSVQPNTLRSRAQKRDLSQVQYNFNIPVKGKYTPSLERYYLDDFQINVEKGSLLVLVDGQVRVWPINKMTDSFVFFSPVEFLEGEHVVSFETHGANLAKVVTSEVAFGKKYDDAMAIFEVQNFDSMVNYLVNFNYRHIYGDFPSVVVEQRTATSPVRRKTENLPNYPQWTPFSFYYEPVRTMSRMVVVLNMPGYIYPLGTKIEFEDVEIRKVFDNKLILIEEKTVEGLAVPEVEFKKKSPISYQGIVKGGLRSHILVFSENYSPDWKLTVKNLDGSKILTQPLHFSANLYANGWYLEGMPETYKIEIYYQPQKIFYWGAFTSIVTVVGGFSLVIVNRLWKRR